MITGVVRKELIDLIFSCYFPHYADLSDNLNAKVKNFAGKYKEDIIGDSNTSLVKRLFTSKVELTFNEDEATSCKTVRDLSNMNSYIYFPQRNDILEIDDAIQDLRKVMEIKAVAKRSFGGKVYASLGDLLALERVCTNKEYYMELDKVIEELEY